MFWSGNGDAKTTVADWQRSFRKLCKLAGIEGHFHMLRDSFACSLLQNGVGIETVSVPLGHSSVKITEKHYAPWVQARQRQLEEAVKKAWA